MAGLGRLFVTESFVSNVLTDKRAKIDPAFNNSLTNCMSNCYDTTFKQIALVFVELK
jgi:hypothetical protein